MKIRSAIILAWVLALAGCAVTGVGRNYKVPNSNDKIFINARVNGATLQATVFIDEEKLITHSFAPFANSTTTKKASYKGHAIRATFKMIKSYGTSTVVIAVFVDDEIAADFVF